MYNKVKAAKRIKLALTMTLMILASFTLGIKSCSSNPNNTETVTGSSILQSVSAGSSELLPDSYYPPFEATGKEFVIKYNRLFPNLKIVSTEEVHIIIEIYPMLKDGIPTNIGGMVSFYIESVNPDITSTYLTISGLDPFWKDKTAPIPLFRHQDGYFQEEFMVDAEGRYSYTQEIETRHHVYIQNYKGTIDIGTEAASGGPYIPNPYYDYNLSTRTYTLKQNLVGLPPPVIRIVANNITLDGSANYYSIIGPGSGYGIYVPSKTGVKITRCRIHNFTYGAQFYESDNIHFVDNNLTGLSVGFNLDGINTTPYQSGGEISGNNISAGSGISVKYYSNLGINNNIMTRSTADRWGVGLNLSSGVNHTLSNNTISGFGYNFAVIGLTDDSFNHNIDTTNTVDGKPVYYIQNIHNQTYDASNNAGVFYAIGCSNIIVKDVNISYNQYGVYFRNTTYPRIENVTASNNGVGIALYNSGGTSETDPGYLLGNIVNSNLDTGIIFQSSSYNQILDNKIQSNGRWIRYNGGELFNGIGLWMDNSHSNELVYNTISGNGGTGGTGLFLNVRYLPQTPIDLRKSNKIYYNNIYDNMPNDPVIDIGQSNVICDWYDEMNGIFDMSYIVGGSRKGNFWGHWDSPGFYAYPGPYTPYDCNTRWVTDSSPYLVRDGWYKGYAPGQMDITLPTVANVSISPDPTTINPALTAIASDAVGNITAAEFWGEWDLVVHAMSASDGNFDNKTENITAVIDITGMNDGIYKVWVRARDEAGNWASPVSRTFIINKAPLLISNPFVTPSSFNPVAGESTTISYCLSEPAQNVVVTAVDALSNIITLYSGSGKSGVNSFIWNASTGSFPAGQYTITFNASNPWETASPVQTNLWITNNPVIRDLSAIPNPFYPTGTQPKIEFTTSQNMDIRIWIEDIAGTIITSLDIIGTISDWRDWDGTNASNFGTGGTPMRDGIYGYGIKQIPTENANRKTGTIVLRRNNTDNEISSDLMTNLYFNPSVPYTETIQINITELADVPDAAHAIITADPPIYLMSKLYDITSDQLITFPADSPGILVLQYDPSIVGDVSASLRLRHWTGVAWVDVENQRIDTAHHQIIAEIYVLSSLFAIFSVADSTPPVITITSPEPIEYFNRVNGEPNVISITYTAEDPVINGISSGISYTRVTLNGLDYTENTIDLSNLLGENILTVIAVDGSGNVTQKSVRFTIIPTVSIQIKPETLKVNPGVLTVFVQFSNGYDVSTIADVTCDDARYESMELSEDRTTMAIKFRRKAIQDALTQKGEVLDAEFEVRGTFKIGDKIYTFKGIDSIKKILPD